MPKNKEQLKKIFFENASPEERLAWEKKQLEKKLKVLEEMPPEVIKGDKGEKPTKEELVEIIKPLIPPLIPEVEGETIVQKIKELELESPKQIDLIHVKN